MRLPSDTHESKSFDPEVYREIATGLEVTLDETGIELSDDAFCQALGDTTGVTQSKINALLTANDLSASSKPNKKEKIRQLVTHLRGEE